MTNILEFPLKNEIDASEREKRIVRTFIENVRPYIDPTAWEYVREETVKAMIKYFSMEADLNIDLKIYLPESTENHKQKIMEQLNEKVDSILKNRQAFTFIRIGQLYGEIYRLRDKLISSGIDPDD